MLFLCWVYGFILLFSAVPGLTQEDAGEAAIPADEDDAAGGTEASEGGDATTSTSTSTTTPRPETTTIINAPSSIEILQIYVPQGQGNAVKLIWGHKTDQQFNFTYGIHYGIEEEELSYAKNTTNELNALIDNLEYCTMYHFAISANSENKINHNDIRSIVTEINREEPPVDFTVDFQPGEQPCLLIRWSSSCANYMEPISYNVTLHEYRDNRTMNITLPKSKRVDYVYPLKVSYGSKFDIKVALNYPNSKPTEMVTFQVPSFLQPYKVKVTTNPEESGAFLIYWSENYVPFYVGGYYYEVFIYVGPQISPDFEKFYVTRPVITFKGEEPVYTFLIGLVSVDQRYRSLLTNPIVATRNGETTELSVGFS